jgi:hypothetical protein
MDTWAALKSKAYREDKKVIESKLHPNPIINGIKICHEHKGKQIIFSAWKDLDRINNKSFSVDRREILFCNSNIYEDYVNAFTWLTEQ